MKTRASCQVKVLVPNLPEGTTPREFLDLLQEALGEWADRRGAGGFDPDLGIAGYVGRRYGHMSRGFRVEKARLVSRQAAVARSVLAADRAEIADASPVAYVVVPAGQNSYGLEFVLPDGSRREEPGLGTFLTEEDAAGCARAYFPGIGEGAEAGA